MGVGGSLRQCGQSCQLEEEVARLQLLGQLEQHVQNGGLSSGHMAGLSFILDTLRELGSKLSQTGGHWAMAQTGVGQSFEWVNIAAGMMLKRLHLTAAHDTLHTKSQDCMGRKDSRSQPTIVLMRCCRHRSAEQQCALLAALHATESTHRLFLLLARLRSCTAPAMARASMVFPVPGGPTSRTPLGSLPPSVVNL